MISKRTNQDFSFRMNLGINEKSLKLKSDFILQRDLEKIQNTSVFKNIDSKDLEEILLQSRISQFNKQTLLFLQGEKATRFYIVLEGSIKLFMENKNGEESIVEIAESGECILETILVNDFTYPVTAQVLSQVRLLSIPINMIHSLFEKNKVFSQNLFNSLAKRSQNVIKKFEQITLRNSTQRVGWFILNLFLKWMQKSDIGFDHKVKLPYDKAIIALYLGMKPETFSRSLQELKTKSIDIERGEVNLFNVYALCEYCDNETSKLCKYAGTKECSNLDFL